MNLRAIAVNAVGLALANADAGVHETGDNAGDQIEFWQKTTGGSVGESYCADFVYAMLLKSWCSAKSLLAGKTDADNRAIMLAHADVFSAETHIPRTGYCPTVAARAKTQGRFHTAQYAPSAGDLVLFDFHGQGEPHHVAFCVSRNVDGTIRTVEGNTGPGDSGNQGNGDGVYRRVRPRTHIYGFVHFE